MKPKPHELARLLKAPPETLRGILLYGPESNLVRDRADQAARAVVPDPRDPFRLSELAGERLAADPARLVDEASAIAMMGGRRVVRVRNAGEAAAPALAGALESVAGDTLIVVEAGDLGSRAKLVKLFEAAPNAAAIACYPLDDGALAAEIEQALAEAGMAAPADMVAALAARLGPDMGILRREIDKLALYLDGAPLDEAALRAATAAGTGDGDLDDLIDAVCAGELAAAAGGGAEALAGGASPVQLLRMLSIHLMRLHAIGLRTGAGQDFDGALAAARLFLPWSRKAALQRQLARWPRAKLQEALGLLLEAERLVKRTGYPEEAIAARAALQLAALARRASA